MWKSIHFRIFAAAALIVLAVTGPWWLALLLCLVGAWNFPNFYEAAPAGMIFDLLYGGREFSFWPFQFAATVLVIIIVAAVQESRDYLIFTRSR